VPSHSQLAATPPFDIRYSRFPPRPASRMALPTVREPLECGGSTPLCIVGAGPRNTRKHAKGARSINPQIRNPETLTQREQRQQRRRHRGEEGSTREAPRTPRRATAAGGGGRSTDSADCTDGGPRLPPSRLLAACGLQLAASITQSDRRGRRTQRTEDKGQARGFNHGHTRLRPAYGGQAGEHEF